MLLTLRGINSRLVSQSILYEDRLQRKCERRYSSRQLVHRKILITVTKNETFFFFAETHCPF